jgi:hypothetical protein
MLRLHPPVVQDPNEECGDRRLCHEALALYSQARVVSCVQIPSAAGARSSCMCISFPEHAGGQAFPRRGTHSTGSIRNLAPGVQSVPPPLMPLLAPRVQSVPPHLMPQHLRTSMSQYVYRCVKEYTTEGIYI